VADEVHGFDTILQKKCAISVQRPNKIFALQISDLPESVPVALRSVLMRRDSLSDNVRTAFMVLAAASGAD